LPSIFYDLYDIKNKNKSQDLFRINSSRLSVHWFKKSKRPAAITLAGLYNRRQGLGKVREITFLGGVNEGWNPLPTIYLLIHRDTKIARIVISICFQEHLTYYYKAILVPHFLGNMTHILSH
jgi:hypothetical protein